MINPDRAFALWIPIHRQEEFNADMKVCINEYILTIVDNKQYYPQVIPTTVSEHIKFLMGNLLMYYGTLLDYNEAPEDEHIYKYRAILNILNHVLNYAAVYEFDPIEIAYGVDTWLQTNLHSEMRS
jgi:hypothetical protein